MGRGPRRRVQLVGIPYGRGGPQAWDASGFDWWNSFSGTTQTNEPIILAAACQTGLYTPDLEKQPSNTSPPSPQSYNAFSNVILAHATTGGGIAYAGETVVMPDDVGSAFLGDVMAHLSGGERTLGDMWRLGQQDYWHDALNSPLASGDVSGPFREPRIYPGIMTLFGDPSLRIQRGQGPVR